MAPTVSSSGVSRIFLVVLVEVDLLDLQALE